MTGQVRSQKSEVRKRISLFFLSSAFCLLSCSAGSAEGPAEEHYRRGLAFQRLDKLQEAYTELQQACALDDKNAQAFLALGIVATRLSRFEEAQRALERSLALDPQSVATYYHLAFLYERDNRREDALVAWTKVVELSQESIVIEMAQKHIANLRGRPVVLPGGRR